MTNSAFRFCDDLGPKTILHIYQPAVCRGNWTACRSIEMMGRMKQERILPREAAIAMARERVGAAMQYQRFNAGRRLSAANTDVILRAAS